MPRKKTIPTNVVNTGVKQGTVANLIMDSLDLYRAELLTAVQENDLKLSPDDKTLLSKLAAATLVGVQEKALSQLLKLYER